MRVEIIEGSKLRFFQDLYREARSESEEIYESLEKFYKQYKGSNEIDGSAYPAPFVRNITYELVESQVTGYIPNPSVSPKEISDTNETNAKSIETLLRNKRDELPFEKMNDLDERFNPIYGGSVWLVEWDDSVVTHNTVGDVRVTCLSPKQFTGQPNIYDVKDMEYCFLQFETTKEDIERKYGVSPKIADEAESDESADEKTATTYVCYYKNDEDKVCEYVWSGDTELLDIEDYYSRKRYVCRKCKKRKEICTCEGNGELDYDLVNEEEEVIERDIVLPDGAVIPAMSQVIEDGIPKVEIKQVQGITEGGGIALGAVGDIFLPVPTTIEVPVLEQTKIPFYRPNILPVVIRKNTSQEDSLFGQSDCEFIRPQQQAINKIESRIIKKLIRGGVYPTTPDDSIFTFNEGVFEDVIKVNRENYKLYGRIDLQAAVSQDVAEAERLYDQAKRILGITDSFQGQYDGSAQSGKAKQLQIQQAAGRLDSKRRMKNAAYAELDQIIFQYYLAYADEPRPSAYKDFMGRLQNCTFNRYAFVERDESGKYYYNDGYLFSADASIDYERSRESMWEQNLQNFQMGAFGAPQSLDAQLIYWLNQERAHYPNAHDNVERIKMQIQQLARQQAQQVQQQAAAGANQQAADYETYLQNQGGMSNVQ